MPTFFRIKGTVSREPFSTEKFAKVSILSLDDAGRKSYFDVKTFSATMINAIREMRVGDEVSIDGELMSEKVMLDRDTVAQDARGRDIWATALKATVMSPEKSAPGGGGGGAKPAEPKMSKSMPPKEEKKPRDFDDSKDVPF